MSSIFDIFNLPEWFTTKFDEKEYASLSTKTAKKIFSKDTSISNFVRPIKYADIQNKIFYCNDNGHFGASLEIVPRIIMGNNVAEVMADIFEDMPERLYMQVSLYGLENIENFLRTYEISHKVRNDKNINEIVDSFVDFYRSKTKEELTQNIESNLKSLRVVISLKSKDRKALTHYLQEIEYKLNANSFFPYRLGKNELHGIYSELLNYYEDLREINKVQESKFFNKQTTKINQETRVEDSYIKLGITDKEGNFKGRYWQTLGIEEISENFSISDFSSKIGAVLGNKENINKNQFKDNFIISFNITKAKKAEISGISINQTIADKQIGDAKDTELQDKKKESREVQKHLGNEENLYKCDIVVCVSGRTKELVEQNATDVRNFWKKGNYKSGQIKLERANKVHLPLFLSSLPMGLNNVYFEDIQDKPYFWNSEIASQFVPLETAWQGNATNFIAVSRRNTLIGIDLHETDEGKNAYFTGTTGAGKSVGLANIIFHDYARGGRVFILDIGASYENMVEALGGTFLQPNKEKPISFNFLAQIENENDLKTYKLLATNWFYLVGGNKDPQTFLKEQNVIKGLLETVIVDVWKKCKNENVIMTPTHIQEELFKIAEKDEDRRIRDFAISLGKICKNGVHEDFFTGKPLWNIRDSDLVCMDFTKIQDDADLRDNLIFITTFFFSEAVYKGDGTRKITFVIDEFHKHLGKNPHLDKEVDEAYRTYRKHEGAIITGSQGFDDYHNSPVGNVIINNSAWAFFGKQKEVAQNTVLNSGLFSFDDYEKDAFINPTGIRGEYSEFMIITPEHYKIPVRFIFPYIFIVLTEASVKRKTYIENVSKHLKVSRYEAIKMIANNIDYKSKLEEIRKAEFLEEEKKKEEEKKRA
jgi:conjugal transfer ATP-binding protein TraC